MSMTGFTYGVVWDDFQGDPQEGDEAAFTKAVFNVSWASRSSGGGLGLTNIVVAVDMVRAQSWVREGAQTASLLEHEQGHYDITALGARDLDRDLAGVTASNMARLRTAVNQLIARHQQEVNRLNLLFDDRTTHGTNAQQELLWIGRIRTAKADPSATLSSVAP